MDYPDQVSRNALRDLAVRPNYDDYQNQTGQKIPGGLLSVENGRFVWDKPQQDTDYLNELRKTLERLWYGPGTFNHAMVRRG